MDCTTHLLIYPCWYYGFASYTIPSPLYAHRTSLEKPLKNSGMGSRQQLLNACAKPLGSNLPICGSNGSRCEADSSREAYLGDPVACTTMEPLDGEPMENRLEKKVGWSTLCLPHDFVCPRPVTRPTRYLVLKGLDCHISIGVTPINFLCKFFGPNNAIHLLCERVVYRFEMT